MGLLIQSYTVEDNEYDLGFGSGPTFVDEVGTSIQAVQDVQLGSIEVNMRRGGSPTGSISAKIYAHSGVFGTSSVPTGSALATSNPITIDNWSNAITRARFNFADNNVIRLTGGTNYCISIAGNFSFSDNSNFIGVRYDVTGATGPGNAYWRQGGNYAAFNTDDMTYWLYGADVNMRVPRLRPAPFKPGLAR